MYLLLWCLSHPLLTWAHNVTLTPPPARPTALSKCVMPRSKVPFGIPGAFDIVRLPRPGDSRIGSSSDPGPDRTVSNSEPAQTVAGAMRNLELGSTQWRGVRHDMPGLDAGAGTCGPYLAATCLSPKTQYVRNPLILPSDDGKVLFSC